jgi:hypothetical protein
VQPQLTLPPITAFSLEGLLLTSEGFLTADLLLRLTLSPVRRRASVRRQYPASRIEARARGGLASTSQTPGYRIPCLENSREAVRC